MKKVLFVCLGNICRSPMAEFVMKEKVKQAGLSDKIYIESAATSSWEHGNPVHSGTKRQLALRGIETFGKTSRPLVKKDFEVFDVIVGMDNENVRDIRKLSQAHSGAEIALFLDVVSTRKNQGVPDPYYTGNFEETYDLVEEACEKWLEKWRIEEEWD